MSDLCTIAFQSEAFDSAANVLRSIEGYTVTVITRESNDPLVEDEQFDARLIGLTIGDDGQYKAWFGPWDEERGAVDPDASAVVLDIYDDIERIEVI